MGTGLQTSQTVFRASNLSEERSGDRSSFFKNVTNKNVTKWGQVFILQSLKGPMLSGGHQDRHTGGIRARTGLSISALRKPDLNGSAYRHLPLVERLFWRSEDQAQDLRVIHEPAPRQRITVAVSVVAHGGSHVR